MPRNSEWQWVNIEYIHSMVCFWPIRILHCCFCSHFNARKFLLWWVASSKCHVRTISMHQRGTHCLDIFAHAQGAASRVRADTLTRAFMQSFSATRDPLELVVMRHFLFRTSSINYFQYGAKPYWLARKSNTGICVRGKRGAYHESTIWFCTASATVHHIRQRPSWVFRGETEFSKQKSGSSYCYYDRCSTSNPDVLTFMTIDESLKRA